MFCSQCGYNLVQGNEKFCPSCGTKIDKQTEVITNKKNTSSIGIADTKGDVFGIGFSGSGNIIGKEVSYTLQGNVINLHIDNTSKEVITESLQKIMAVQTQIDQSSISTASNVNKDKIYESEKTHQQIKNILEEVTHIEKKEGIQIHEIRAENIQISTKELLLKELILKGNEYLYRKDYLEAIRYYDKAIDLDPNNIEGWNNKGYALDALKRNLEAVKCYNKAIELDPNNATPWNNKGSSLRNLGESTEDVDMVVEGYNCIEKAINLDPNKPYAWNNKGEILAKMGRYDEAIMCFDKALKLDPSLSIVRDNKQVALDWINRNKKKKGWFR